MNVEKRWFADFTPREIEEIRARQETVVVVDLWAATTNIVLMLGKKPERLIIINDEKYSEATNVYPGAVLVGQSHRIPQEEFVSASNRSLDVDKVDVEGKVVFYLTFNGTRVLESFSTREKGLVFVGSMTNYGSLARYIEEKNIQNVHIVAAGNLTGEMGGVVMIEDLMGAEVIDKRLRGEEFDFEDFSNRIKKAMVEFHLADMGNAEVEIWPFIFGQETGVVPTSFVNDEGFVEVVDYGPSRRG